MDFPPLKLRVFIDRGGTFTDVVALTGDGRSLVSKALSTSTSGPVSETEKDPAALAVARIVDDLQKENPNRKIFIEEVRLGTTVATNALLERRGEPTVLVTNSGFGDALTIGYQSRPDIFALHIEKPPPLFCEVIELDCRFDKDGHELSPFPEQLARELLQQSFARGLKSVAVVFMHGYKFPAHEVACAAVARALGFEQVSLSHRCSGLVRYVSRGDTTLVDAYLTPPLQRYLERVSSDFKNTPMYFMKSDGGLTTAAHFSGKDAILSGPAGGVLGAVAVARAHQQDQALTVVGFDMGGTSTDVSYYRGVLEKQMQCTIAGVRLTTPMVAVHTVAAGGGSVLHCDGKRFLVGPQSAGANPGPACYGRGGPATITDANLLLGRLSPEHFPRLFGPQGNGPLERLAAEKRFAEIVEQLQTNSEASKQAEIASPYKRSEAVADGFLTVAVEKMAQAIAAITLQKGHDVRGATMVAFGGAGGQQACAIAERLQIKKILLSPMAGVLSAYGIGATTLSESRQKTIAAPLSAEILKAVLDTCHEMEAECLAVLGPASQFKRRLGLAYKGSDTTLWVDYDTDAASITRNFCHEHQKLFGFTFEGDAAIIIESVLIESSTPPRHSSQLASERNNGKKSAHALVPADAAHATDRYTGQPWKIYYGGEMLAARLFQRSMLAINQWIAGPALITEEISTTVVDPGWQARLLEDGCLLLSRDQEGDGALPSPLLSNGLGKAPGKADPVMLELFNNIFMSIAEEMGLTLQKVSHSVNIKERLDFSCALFDEQGRLIANAPHIPVHLGSMGDSVASLLRDRGLELAAGQAYVLNNPYNGGTHLPDMTVISPIFSRENPEQLLFFVGSRGHHADIGGITPGSMPASSRHIEEEGVLFDNLKVLADGRFLEEDFVAALSTARYPARNIAQNIKDLQAQIAANNKGCDALYKTIDRYGLDTVRAYMAFVRQNAADEIASILAVLPSGKAICAMDDGSEIHVKVSVDQAKRRATIDFTGTSPQADNNLNAPLAVTRAAVLYVFRTLSRSEIPLNDGCSEPLDLIVPEGCLLNPRCPAAVVAGNVETSQVVVDALYQAIGALAGSQGTMNNFTFGDAEHQYYETIAGGSGAGPGFSGCDAVQTHMTNSRLTDPEILEERFPVILEEFSIRRHSGGSGQFTGGCGTRRRIRFLKGMSATILSNRRKSGAPGLNGGGAGAPGANYLVDANGAVTALASTDTVEVKAGETIVIETPGGGGANLPKTID
ncbi:MAG: hydantoinase B/oxoprolinase family protein [Cyanobacteria bacterium REEB67]|nr:hydantoinase B/oxoprolinase family protein [Cyanobacteria bacterium REEB67]